METIASRKNPLVLLMRRVAQGDADERGRVLLDGLHLVQEARTAGLSLSTAAFTTKVLGAPDGAARRLATTLAGLGCRVAQVSDTVMEAMSPASTPSGVVALAARPRHDLAALLPPAVKQPFLCVAAGVQDPGNVGAIVRVAEAGGASGVIVTGNSADPYGWKALRGAMGSAFRLPVVREPDVDGVLAALREAGVRVLATAPAGNGPVGNGPVGNGMVMSRRSFSDKPLTGACAFLLGGEGPGLPEAIISAADGVITIPMEPPVESLNVAVSAGLIIYEARRQRLG
jgi:RNA methyltransferase, TrmH family